MAASKPATIRVRQAVAFLGGAVALAVVVGGEPGDFYLTPLALGLAYLAAAALGGRDGGHWSTACVLVGWGLAVIFVNDGIVNTGSAPAYLAGAGLGGLVAAALERGGFGVDLAGVAAATAFAGLVLGLSGEAAVLEEAETYAAALAVLGAVNLVLAMRAPAAG